MSIWPTRKLVREQWVPVGAGGSLMLLTLLSYLPALLGGFVWDDDSWTIRLGSLFHDSSGLGSIWLRPTAMQQYYPLSGTTFWVDYQLWGFRPFPYHLENVLLHGSSALLFWRVLRRLEVQGAWLASAGFALHPVMVESVAWIAERKNVLSMVLCLGAALAYLRYELAAEPAELRPLEVQTAGARSRPVTRQAAGFYVLAWLLFLAALLAKTFVCTFPAVILLLAWWRRGRFRWRQDVLPTLPFFAVAIGMCAVTAWLEKNHVGAQGPDYALSVSQRVLIAGRAFWFYLGKLVWPADLCFIYPRWKPDAGHGGQWLYPITAIGTLAALWLARKRIGRGPVTALLFFAGTLAPVLGFVNVYFMRYSFVCDHWAYFSTLAPIALVAAGLNASLKHFGAAQSVSAAGGGALLLVLAALTWQQAGTYADLESLWQSTIDRNPDCWVAYNSLGNALFRRGQTQQAISDFQKAVSLKPDLAEAHTSLGVALASKGELPAAFSSFQQGIRVNPEYAEAHYDLALAFMQLGRTGEAIEQLREAVRLKPDFPAARYRLALVLRHERRAE